MRNLWIVIKHEVLTTMSKRSFWIMTILFPAVIIALNIGTQMMAVNAAGSTREMVSAEGDPAALAGLGYVDHAGLIQAIPELIPAGAVKAYPDEAAAQTALAAGEVGRYYVLPADFMATGHVVLVDSQFRPFGNLDEGLLEYVINFNLSRDETLASLLIDPTPVVIQRPIAPQNATDRSNPLTFFVPFATMFIFFFLLTMSSGFMLQSVAREKENRTAEVLLLSLRPRELMLGKIVGLSVVALLQMAVWMGASLLALDRGRQAMEAAAAFTLPPGFLLWAVLYFLFGYLLYASLMGAIGALAPSAREAGQFTFIILLPLMAPLWLNNVFIQAPGGNIALFFSLFPLTAPTSMMTRLATGTVPTWQALAGLLGLAVTAYLFVLLSARFFRADTLLSSSALQWRRVLAELRR